jgi:hypothetical protein
VDFRSSVFRTNVLNKFSDANAEFGLRAYRPSSTACVAVITALCHMLSAVVLDITGGLVISTSPGVLAEPDEEDDDDEVGVITMDALSTNPVIDARRAAVPSSIISALLTLAVGWGRGARGLVLIVPVGFRACCCRAGRGMFGVRSPIASRFAPGGMTDGTKSDGTPNWWYSVVACSNVKKAAFASFAWLVDLKSSVFRTNVLNKFNDANAKFGLRAYRPSSTACFAVVLDITGGLVISISFGVLTVPDEEDDDDEAGVITMDALFTNPVIDTKSAAVPSSIISVLLTLVVDRWRGAGGLVLIVLVGFRVCCCRAGRGMFGI